MAYPAVAADYPKNVMTAWVLYARRLPPQDLAPVPVFIATVV